LFVGVSQMHFKDFLHYYVKPEYAVDLHTNTVHLTDHSSFFLQLICWILLFCYMNNTKSNLKSILLLHIGIRYFAINALLPFYLI
jgi:hypothetical protein